MQRGVDAGMGPGGFTRAWLVSNTLGRDIVEEFPASSEKRQILSLTMLNRL